MQIAGFFSQFLLKVARSKCLTLRMRLQAKSFRNACKNVGRRCATLWFCSDTDVHLVIKHDVKPEGNSCGDPEVLCRARHYINQMTSPVWASVGLYCQCDEASRSITTSFMMVEYVLSNITSWACTIQGSKWYEIINLSVIRQDLLRFADNLNLFL